MPLNVKILATLLSGTNFFFLMIIEYYVHQNVDIYKLSYK